MIELWKEFEMEDEVVVGMATGLFLDVSDGRFRRILHYDWGRRIYTCERLPRWYGWWHNLKVRLGR